MNNDASTLLTPRQHEFQQNHAFSSHKIHKLTNASTQGRVQHWFDIEVHQLGAGAYKGACATLSSERMHLVHERQNRLIHKVGIMPKNNCTISFALGQGSTMRFSHFLALTPRTFLLPENTEFDILVPDQIETLYLCIEQERLMEGARIINPRFWDAAPQGLQAYNTPDTVKLASGLLKLLNPSTLATNSALSAQTETLLLDTILLALDKSTDVQIGDLPECQARRRANKRVNVAREFINANLQAGQLPSIVDVCVQTGASARSLQYAFREVMEMTPVAYLRILRLNKVRSALETAITADATVTQIAIQWGFFHLGEFARDYKRLFGESPSDTLARAKARHHVS